MDWVSPTHHCYFVHNPRAYKSVQYIDAKFARLPGEPRVFRKQTVEQKSFIGLFSRHNDDFCIAYEILERLASEIISTRS